MSRVRILKKAKNIAEYVENNPPPGWKNTFSDNKQILMIISDLVAKDSLNVQIYPDLRDTFKCFELTPLSKIKVAIIGQDPYHNGSATGLAFSCKTGTNPSLNNIYKEINNSYPEAKFNSGDLTHWALQGVLLLNTSLTVRANEPNSHSKYDLWAPFISKVIKQINESNPSCIYVLWGREAQKITKFLSSRNRILTAGHPSPLNRTGNFLGCGHFKEINKILESEGKETISWGIL